MSRPAIITCTALAGLLVAAIASSSWHTWKWQPRRGPGEVSLTHGALAAYWVRQPSRPAGCPSGLQIGNIVQYYFVAWDHSWFPRASLWPTWVTNAAGGVI